MKTGTGQLLATFKDCEQDYVSYPVSAVVGDAEAASEASKEKAAEEQSCSAQSAKADEKAEAEQKTEAAPKTESKENAASTQSITAEAKSEKTEKAASSSEENKTSADEKQASASSTSSEAKKAADAKATADTTRSAASPKLPFTARMLKSQLSAAQTAVTSDANVDLAISSDDWGKVRSGSSLQFAVNFKVSGSRYDEGDRWPATLAFSLKDTANGHLHINGDALPLINGVKGTMVGDKAVYTFNSKNAIQAGQAYSIKIAVLTDAGYIVDGTTAELVGRFEDATGFSKEASASKAITATDPIAVSKTFLGAKNETSNTAPGLQDVLAWRISVSVQNTKGVTFVNSNKKITIVDTMTDGTFFSTEDSSVTVKNKALRSVTFELDAPSLAEQEQNLKDGLPIYTKSFIVYTQPTYWWQRLETITNKINVTYQNIQGKDVQGAASAQAVIGKSRSEVPDYGGDIYFTTFYGPKNGEGVYDRSTVLTTVYDTASLTYKTEFVTGTDGQTITQKFDKNGNLVRTGITSLDFNANFIKKELLKNGIKQSVVQYNLNEHLLVNSIGLRKPIWQLYTKEGKKDIYTSDNMPGYLVKLKLKNAKTGETRTVSRFVTPYADVEVSYFPVSYFGVGKDDRILNAELSLQYEDGDKLMDARTYGEVFFQAGIEKGFTGRIRVTNKVWVVESDGTKYTHESPNNEKNRVGSYYSPIGPREVDVIKKDITIPIGMIDTAFQKHAPDGNSVIDRNSTNRVEANFYNVASSQVDMKSKVGFVILLPKGVTVSDNPDYELYLVNDKTGEEKQLSLTGGNDATSYSYAHYVKGSDVNNTGLQVVKFVMGDGTDLKPGYHLRGEANVDVGNIYGNVILNAYGGSYTGKLTTPTGFSTIKDLQESKVADGGIYLQVRSLMGDDPNYQQVVTNLNSYKLSTYDQVKVHKYVKGDLDDDYGQMAHTTPGGSVSYKLQITAGQQINKMTLMDVLPSVGDYGITDNVNRGSQFDMKLTGPITLSNLSDATIKYSTSKNPSRSVLNDSISWPDGGTKLADKNAENATWLTASQVTDWSKIHSFMISLGDTKIKTGQTVDLEFTMQAPQRSKLSTSQLSKLFDQSVAEKERAAWNSFAITANNLMPVEPERVGVVMSDAGVSLLKEDALTHEKLTGVKFKLADTEANAKAGRFLRIKDGKVLVPGESGYAAASDYEATSKNGVVSFYGLQDGQTYYAVETEAVSGYQLDSTPHAVVASYKPSSKQITVYNHREIILPKTGSSWMALFLIVGISGILAGFYFSRKKKEKD